MSENNVTFGALLKRVEALEAAAKPKANYAPIHTVMAERDQQAERIDALERELGGVRESYRQSVENHKACLEQLRLASERADANQSAADTLERLARGDSVEICGERMRLFVSSVAGELVELKCELPKAQRERDAALAAAETHRHSHDTLERLKEGKWVGLPVGGGSLDYRLIDTSLWDSLHKTTEMFERLRNGDIVNIDGRLMMLNGSGWGEKLLAERDALAAKVAARDRTIAAQDLQRQELERRLAESENRERGHVAMIGAKCDEIAELKRRMADANGKADSHYGDAILMEALKRLDSITLPRLGKVLLVGDDELADLRRDAERWRWAWSHSFIQFDVDAAIAAEKQPEPPTCQKCGSNLHVRDSVHSGSYNYCTDCEHRWPKEATK